MLEVNTNNKPSLVDIIIPVYNRLEHTKQTIESLLANTDSKYYNLYVIDDNSTEKGVKEYLREKAVEHGFTLFFNEENIGPGASRNLVCKHIFDRGMRSVYLYHSDNDVYFKPGWLETLVKIYQELYEDVLLLGGGCHPYLQNSKRLETPFGYMVGVKDAVSGYSQLMGWDVWDQYGPFDESMRGQDKKIMGSEDWAFCQKIVKDGFLVGSVEPEVVIATGKTNTYGEPATGSETFKEVEGVKVI